VERAVILSHENRLDLNLPDLHSPVQSDPFSDKPTLDEIQQRYIKHIIESTGGKISGPGGAAEVLDLKRTSLYSRMKGLKIKR
jgi:formate hydrogenlyase transcriptional activator